MSSVPAGYTYLVENALGALMVGSFLLIILATLGFIILVTYLEQWDIYYPAIDRWLKARKKAKLEKVRKDKRREQKLRRRDQLRD